MHANAVTTRALFIKINSVVEGKNTRTVITFDDLHPKHVPHLMLEELLAFLKGMGIPCTLFVIPTDQSGQYPEDEYVESLKNAKVLGHEIALHGYSHRNNEFGYIIPVPLPTFEKQKILLKMGKKYLQEILEEPPVGFRAPSYRHSKITFKALTSLDFKYDSSGTVFKPTHGMRFRLRTSLMPRPVKFGSLFEIPVTADYTYNLDCTSLKKRLKQARSDYDWVKALDGVFVVNNHINRSGRRGLEFLRILIDELHESDFVRLKDLIS